MNTEDRQLWYDKAERWEIEFVEKYGEKFNLIINPSKSINKYAPDLYLLKTSEPADLKVQNEPFYKSKELYGIDPNYCWTFNVSDMVEYLYKYNDDFGIIIWVRYHNCSGYGVTVQDTESIYYTTIGRIKKHAKVSGNVHKYVRRINDTNGNAYGSHTLDLSDNSVFKRIYHSTTS